jgi:hypothetical protein
LNDIILEIASLNLADRGKILILLMVYCILAYWVS